MRTVKKQIFTFKCLVIFIFTFLLFPLSYESTATKEWTIEEIEQQLFKDEEYKEVIQYFNLHKEQIKQDNTGMYYYITGVVQVINNDYNEAYISFEEALASSMDTNQIDLAIATLKQLVLLNDVYADSGSLVEYGNQLLELAEQNEDVETEMFAYNTIALAFYYIANDDKAAELLDYMLLLAHEHDNKFYQGIYYTIMGHISYSYQEFETAKAYYEEALTLFGAVDSGEVINVNIMTEASLLLTKSQLVENKDSDEIVIEIAELIKQADKRYNKTGMVALLYILKGQIEQQFLEHQKAVTSYEKSEALIKSINHVPKAFDPVRTIHFLLAKAHYDNDDYLQAADLFMGIAEMDENPDVLKNIDEVTSKMRSFTEKDLTDRISTLTMLQEAQKQQIFWQRTVLVLFVFGIVILLRAFILKRKENKKVNLLKNELYIQSITDGLTGVYNRKRIFEILNSERENCGVALIDIDNFKLINDSLGYLVGDEVLKKVVETIQTSIRQNDEVGRYGGEEFLIVFKETNLHEAVSIVERVRKNVESIHWDYEGLKTTISVGVSTKSNDDAEEVFKRVDSLVHEAKRTGKNKVVFNND